MTEPYEPLQRVLSRALEQAAHGKGADRHANGQPFMEQPIMRNSRVAGLGFPTGQALKKIEEAITMAGRGHDPNAVFELLGAINYAAAAILLIEERQS